MPRVAPEIKLSDADSANYQLKAYQDAKLTVFAKGNNLLDQNIRNSTSCLRNFAPETGRGAKVGFRLSY